jgi:hypothetical protein
MAPSFSIYSAGQPLGPLIAEGLSSATLKYNLPTASYGECAHYPCSNTRVKRKGKACP